MVSVDVARRPPNHSLGFAADGNDLIFHRIDGDDGRLVDDDPLIFNEDNDVGRPQVDGDVAAEPIR